jgi:tetratricopeptide (TPR) repeat protein
VEETEIKLWDMTSGEPRRVITMPDQKRAQIVRLSSDGRYLAAQGNYDQPIWLWDLSGKPDEMRAPVAVRYSPFGPSEICGCLEFAFSPDSRLLALAYQFGYVNEYDIETGRNAPWPFAGSWATCVAFSSDGKLLAAGNNAGVVSVLDLERRDVIASFPGHEAGIVSLAFFPDGETLAVRSLGKIRLWDLPSKQERITLKLPVSADTPYSTVVDDLIVTHDGRTLVTRQNNGTLRIWRADRNLADSVPRRASPIDERSAEEDDPSLSARLVIQHASLGQWDRALTAWQWAETVGVEWDAALCGQLMRALPTESEIAKLREPRAARQFRERIMSLVANLKDAKALNALAWNIVSTNARSRSEVEFAVHVAAKAATLYPQDGAIVNTLGVAQYRAGKWQDAIEALEKAMKLRKGGDAFDWFFLAMAHWQLGHKDKARTWYEKAVEWMDKYQPKNEELLRFRNEAAELLGISEPAPSTDAAPQP